MDRDLPDIEELFKSALENEEEMPEPRVWKAIDQVLDKDNAANIKKKYDDLKKVALLLFLLLLGAGIYEFEKQRTTEDGPSTTAGISAEKINGARSVDKSNGAPKKKIELARFTNKPKRLASTSIIVEDGPADIKQSGRNLALVDDAKGVKYFKRKTLGAEDFAQGQVHNATQPNLIKKLQKKKIVELFPRSEEKPFLKDLDLLYAPNPGSLEPGSHHNILPPQLPVLMKVAAGGSEKNSTTEKVKTKNRALSHFSLDLFFSPDFASYRLKDNVPGNNVDEATEIEKDERHEFSMTIGALIEYRASKHWSIQSGLTYSNTNITVNPQTIYAEPDNHGEVKYLLNTSSGSGYVLPSFSSSPAVGDSLYAFTSTHTLQYVSLPVSIKYNITKGKFSFYIMAGIAVNYLIEGKVETAVEDGTNNEREVVNNLHGLKSIYFTGQTGVGADYKLTNKISLTFAPTYRVAINSINKQSPVKSYPNAASFATGLKLDL